MPATLEQYQQLVHFLALTLGPDYEVVLHWRDPEGTYYIAAIDNGDLSGRTLNSPVTGFAMDLVKKKVYLKQDFVTNYKAMANANHELNGSTYFIKDKDNSLLGLLCINFDGGRFIDIANSLLRLAKQPVSVVLPEPEPVSEEPAPVPEVLATRIDDVIESHIDPSILQSDVQLTVQKKVEIVAELMQQGVFQIKGALPRVAKILGVSEPSVYRYIHQVEQSDD